MGIYLYSNSTADDSVNEDWQQITDTTTVIGEGKWNPANTSALTITEHDLDTPGQRFRIADPGGVLPVNPITLDFSGESVGQNGIKYTDNNGDVQTEAWPLGISLPSADYEFILQADNTFLLERDTGGQTATAELEEVEIALSADFTAEAGKNYPVDLSGGTVTVTPPSDGGPFGVYDSAGVASATNALLVDFNLVNETYHSAAGNSGTPNPDAIAEIQHATGGARFVKVNATIGYKVQR